MVTLYRPDRPATGVMEWYAERKDWCIEQIRKLTCDLIDADTDVVLELGLIQQSIREQFFEMASDMRQPVEDFESEGRGVRFISTDE